MKGKWMKKGSALPPADDLAGKSYQELKQLAKEKKIQNYNRMSVEALRSALGGE
jgi:hypothetical protein